MIQQSSAKGPSGRQSQSKKENSTLSIDNSSLVESNTNGDQITSRSTISDDKATNISPTPHGNPKSSIVSKIRNSFLRRTEK